MRAKQGRKRGILRVPGILSEFRGSRRIEPRLRHRWGRLSVSLRDEQGRLRQGCQYHHGVPGEMRWVLEKFRKKYFLDSRLRVFLPLESAFQDNLGNLVIIKVRDNDYRSVCWGRMRNERLRDLRNGFFFKKLAFPRDRIYREGERGRIIRRSSTWKQIFVESKWRGEEGA